LHTYKEDFRIRGPRQTSTHGACVLGAKKIIEVKKRGRNTTLKCDWAAADNRISQNVKLKSLHSNNELRRARFGSADVQIRELRPRFGNDHLYAENRARFGILVV
jgi:hypothetical protein